MSNLTLIKKSDVPPKEPVYNTTTQLVDDPVQKCPLKNEQENIQEPTPLVKRSFFMNLEGEEIQSITKEVEVKFGVETENMAGEEVFIELPSNAGDFEYEGQKIDNDILLKLKIGSDLEVFKLKVVSKPGGIPASKVSKAKPAPKAQTPLPTPSTTKANIVSVEFLDGDKTTTVSGTVNQFVNLPREKKWVHKKTIKNIDRLSNKPRILVKFDKKGKHTFHIKFRKLDGGIEYSEEEKRRNPTNFNYDDTYKKYTTEDDGTLIIADLKIDVGGNNQFEIVAKDSNEKEVTSGGKIKVMRFFYIQEIKMKGSKSAAKDLKKVKEEYKRNFIHLESVDAKKIPRMENVDDDSKKDIKKLQGYISKVINTSKAPYCLSVVFTDYLAIKHSSIELKTREMPVGPNAVDFLCYINYKGKGKGKRKKADDSKVAQRELWKDVVQGESWYKSCIYTYNEKATGQEKKIDIYSNNLTPVPSRSNRGSYIAVEIGVSHLPEGKGIFTLVINVVDTWVAGLAFGGPIVAVGSKNKWKDVNSDFQNHVVIHEIGHKLGMVSNGTDDKPDKVSTYYVEKGHDGQHCYNGNPPGEDNYNTDAFTKNSKCVMFGSLNEKYTKFKFCENCSLAVKKVDLSKGWPRAI